METDQVKMRFAMKWMKCTGRIVPTRLAGRFFVFHCGLLVGPPCVCLVAFGFFWMQSSMLDFAAIVVESAACTIQRSVLGLTRSAMPIGESIFCFTLFRSPGNKHQAAIRPEAFRTPVPHLYHFHDGSFLPLWKDWFFAAKSGFWIIAAFLFSQEAISKVYGKAFWKMIARRGIR